MTRIRIGAALVLAVAALAGCRPYCVGARWPVKTAQDRDVAEIDLDPKPVRLAELVAIPAPPGLPKDRRLAVEKSTFVLRDVKLTQVALKVDGDYHLSLSDGVHTMIAEIPAPRCTRSSPFAKWIAQARATVDEKLAPSFRYEPTNLDVSIIGVGFFDERHGQRHGAPNAIELHPVLAICFGAGCAVELDRR